MAIQWWKTYLLIAIFHFYQGVAGQINNCPTEDNLVQEFNNVSKFMEIYGDDGKVCFMENDEHEHEHENEDHNEDIYKEMTNCSSCENIYHMCRTIILNLQLTSEDCLEEHNHNNNTSGQVSSAQAYGYGFLMILLVCLGSLSGIFLVPLIKKDSKVGKQTYEYVYALLIATGSSALVSDAILHLIPHAFGLHSQEEDSHSHNNGKEDIGFIWKGCVVLGGIYTFFIVEVILHGLGHGHSSEKKSKEESHAEYRCPSGDVHFTSSIPQSLELSSSSSNGESQNGNEEKVLIKKPKHMCSCRDVKPVAWLIIIGDSLHNFADGLALGAAISQSLSLGVSTMFALLFHEIPHELGDYVILVKAGIHWFTALIINFLSSLTSLVGFFIGVAISTNNTEANQWILSLTAGLFLYIALTDLLPELIHGGGHGEKTKNIAHGWSWFIRFALANLGMLIAFAVLLLLAVYEEELNELI